MRKAIVTALFVALYAGAASAQDEMEGPEIAGQPLTGLGLTLGLGGGSWTGDLGDFTSGGVAWDVRANASFGRFFGAELAYGGQRTGVDTIVQSGGGVLTDEDISQHRITVDALVGAPVTMIRDRELRVYGLAGLGYSRLASNERLDAVGLGGDNQFVIPIGAGARWELTPNVIVDGRFTWNVLTDVDVPLADDSADSWQALVSIGAKLGR